MAAWQGTLDEDDLWAVAYYVDSLIALRDTPAAMEMKRALLDQGDWEAPVDEDTAEADPETEAAGSDNPAAE
jgi:hypothetical protein